jgi:hypothetical protein
MFLASLRWGLRLGARQSQYAQEEGAVRVARVLETATRVMEQTKMPVVDLEQRLHRTEGRMAQPCASDASVACIAVCE